MSAASIKIKPNAPACERNREPILKVLRQHFARSKHVLEIGSGTGQHAVHFAAAMPWLTWQCSDHAEHLPGIQAWLDDAALPNTPAPITVDVASFDVSLVRSRAPFDGIFSANTLHIMRWAEVEAFFELIDQVLPAISPDARTSNDAAGTVVVYGPFNQRGAFSSPSNRDFDIWLKARDPHSGIRDFEAVNALAQSIGLTLIDDAAMPANNRCLRWQR